MYIGTRSETQRRPHTIAREPRRRSSLSSFATLVRASLSKVWLGAPPVEMRMASHALADALKDSEQATATLWSSSAWAKRCWFQCVGAQGKPDVQARRMGVGFFRQKRSGERLTRPRLALNLLDDVTCHPATYPLLSECQEKCRSRPRCPQRLLQAGDVRPRWRHNKSRPQAGPDALGHGRQVIGTLAPAQSRDWRRSVADQVSVRVILDQRHVEPI